MPLGIVDNSIYEKDLNDNKVVNKDAIIKKIEIGRGNAKEVPAEIKKFIAECAVEGASNSEMVNATGLSQSSISAYKNGATSTSTYHNKNNELASHITKVKDRISRKARKVLVNSLDALQNDPMHSVKAKDKAAIARSMAAIIKDMEPAIEVQNNDNRVQYVIFAPAMKTEKHFDAIDVQALDVE